MDVVETEGIKIPNAVLVSGLTITEVDKEIFDFPKQFVLTSRIIKVHSTDTVTQAIVEYEHGNAVQALKAIVLPYHRPYATKPEVIHHVQSLASVYICDGGTSSTNIYLSGLKDIEKLSGRDFADILREELARISESISSETSVEASGNPEKSEPSLMQNDVRVHVPNLSNAPTEMSQNPYRRQSGVDAREFPSPRGEQTRPFHLPADQLSTPEVRVVVEHIVKRSEISSHLHSSCKLKQFSGRLPQVDYETWRNSVEFCLKDPTIPDSKKIVESLASPVSNIIKKLDTLLVRLEALTLLDSAYATVEDGDELFARLLNNNQNAGEKASDYLQRLYSVLSYVVAKEGISPHNGDRQLLKLFCRGCWNSLLITSLQLEQLKSKPPSFTEVLL